jgi:hypothetical protein
MESRRRCIMLEGIRTIEVDRDADGTAKHVRLVFGPHYFVELGREDSGHLTFVLGATHHGFRADASDVGGELETIINEIRRGHPEAVVD